MPGLSTLTNRIMKAVKQTPECTLEELMGRCPDLAWGQLFLEIDRLSREGILRLTPKGRGTFNLSIQAIERVKDSPAGACY
jgi:hypothetical protein